MCYPRLSGVSEVRGQGSLRSGSNVSGEGQGGAGRAGRGSDRECRDRGKMRSICG